MKLIGQPFKNESLDISKPAIPSFTWMKVDSPWMLPELMVTLQKASAAPVYAIGMPGAGST